MTASLKSRVVSAFLLGSMLAFPTHARSADGRKPLTMPPQKQEVGSHRERRAFSRREIFQAIQNDLVQKGITGLHPEDLLIQSSLPIQKDDVGLEVTRISFDPIRRATVFELRASHEPQYLPFEVTTRRDPRSLGLASWAGWKGRGANGEVESPNSRQGTGVVGSKPTVLAKPGKPATLIMLGENVRITMTVEPLQPGSKGQRILVRDLDTRRVMAAEVVGEGLLQSNL